MMMRRLTKTCFFLVLLGTMLFAGNAAVFSAADTILYELDVSDKELLKNIRGAAKGHKVIEEAGLTFLRMRGAAVSFFARDVLVLPPKLRLDMNIRFPEELGRNPWHGLYVNFYPQKGENGYTVGFRKGGQIALKDLSTNKVLKHAPCIIEDNRWYEISVYFRNGFFQVVKEGKEVLKGKMPFSPAEFKLTASRPVDVLELKVSKISDASFPESSVKNLALNADFSQGENNSPSFWYPFSLKGTGTYDWVNEGTAGSKCLRIDSDSYESKVSWAQTSIRVKPGTQLYISGKVKLKDLETHFGNGFMAIAHFYGPTGYISWAPSAGMMKTDGWQEFHHEVAVPGNATHTRVSFRLAQAEGTMWVDDILVMGEDPGPQKDGVSLPASSDPVLCVGLIANIQQSPVYQLAAHLARHRISTVWLGAEHLDPDKLKEQCADLDALILVDHSYPSEQTIYNLRLGRVIKDFADSGKGLLVIGLAGLPDSIVSLLPVEPDSGKSAITNYRFAPQPASEAFPWVRELPQPWPGLGTGGKSPVCWHVQTKPGARTVLETRINKETVPVLVLSGSTGQRIAFLNAQFSTAQAGPFFQWRYSPSFLSQLTAWLGKKDVSRIASYGKVPGERDFLKYLSSGGTYFGYFGPLPEEAEKKEPTLRAVLDLDQMKKNTYDWSSGEVPQPRILKSGEGKLIDFGDDLMVRIPASGILEMGLKHGLVVSTGEYGVFPYVGSSALLGKQGVGDISAGASEPQVRYSNELKVAEKANVEKVDIEGKKVRVHLGLYSGESEVGKAIWLISRKDLVLGQELFSGLALELELDIPGKQIASIAAPWTVSLDNPVTPYRLACYSRPRGPFVRKIRSRKDVKKHNVWYFCGGGQPFHFMSSGRGSVISFLSRPALVRAEIRPAVGEKNAVVFDQRMKTGALTSDDLSIPAFHFLFSDREIGPNQWLDCDWFLTRTYCGQYGLEYEFPLPSLQARYEDILQRINANRTGEMTSEMDYSSYTGCVAPIVREDHFRLVDTGSIINFEVTPDILKRRGGEEGIRNLTKKLKEAGADSYIYWRITFWNKNLARLKANPDWVIRNRHGNAMDVSGLYNLSLRSGYRDFAEKSLKHYMDLGVKGAWFDSLSPAVGAIDFSRPKPRPQLYDVIDHFKTMREADFSFWVEGISPLAIDSHWFRYNNYGDSYRENPFMLFGSSLFATNWDTVIFLDYFKAASFLGLPFVDVKVVLHRDNVLTRHIRSVNEKYLQALETIGTFIDIEYFDFGTVWTGDRGFAVFAHEPVALELKGFTKQHEMRLAGESGKQLEADTKVSLEKEDVLFILSL